MNTSLNLQTNPRNYSESYIEIEHVMNLDSIIPKSKHYTTSKYVRGISWCAFFQKTPFLIEIDENSDDITNYYLDVVIEANINESTHNQEFEIIATSSLTIVAEQLEDGDGFISSDAMSNEMECCSVFVRVLSFEF